MAGKGQVILEGLPLQLFDFFEKRIAGLLAQNFAKQHAEGAYIAAEGNFFEVSGPCFELGEAFGPAFGLPEGWHHVYYGLAIPPATEPAPLALYI